MNSRGGREPTSSAAALLVWDYHAGRRGSCRQCARLEIAVVQQHPREFDGAEISNAASPHVDESELRRRGDSWPKNLEPLIP